MKTPDEIRTILREKITQAVNETTEGLLSYNQYVFLEIESLVQGTVFELFREDLEEEETEELCSDMDQFPAEE